MLGWLFGRKKADPLAIQHACSTLGADMHNHLLPGIDDGVKSPEEGHDLIEAMLTAGYRHLICTPHIMPDMYRNTPESIGTALSKYQDQDYFNSLRASGEYFLDDSIRQVLETHPDRLMTFRGSKETYLLVELGFGSVPYGLHDLVFALLSAGIRPVIAHPERYLQLAESNPSYFSDLIRAGCLMQVNIGSFHPEESHPGHRALALALADAGQVHFLGTDIHHEKHWHRVQGALEFLTLKKPRLLNEVLNPTLVPA